MSKHVSPYGEKTFEMTVANTAFLIDRMGEDCHPLQFLRELTQNSIESILRTDEKKGEIIWDVDWKLLSETGYYKLSITDTGDGMTGEQMVKYINQLSSSASEQSFIGNYGVGAKISAATRNHAGLIYLSWRDGIGTMIHLWRDPETEQYGLRQFQVGDRSVHRVEVEDDAKPEIIKGHGTRVVLLGMSNEADTMVAPPSSPSPSRWVAKYLNGRYFRFPEGITVKAREGWTLPRTNKDSNILRTVFGQEDYLKKHSVASGTLPLSGAVAHWWILKDDKSIGQLSGSFESAGHTAALYRDELYELQTGRSGTARLQNFGVILGHRRVVIYVEPLADESIRITTNTARTHLMVNNEFLPWAEWAAEFREKMPKEISELVKESAAGSSAEDHAKSIRERLQQIIDLYKLSRYRPSPNGSLMIDMDALARGGRLGSSDDYAPRTGGGTSGTKGGAAGGAYSAYLKKDGVRGEEVKNNIWPQVFWVSVKDGTREPPTLDDRAAQFLLNQNTLIINGDFRVFTDMIDKFNRDFGGAAVNEIVTKAVRNWFQQALEETVIGIRALQKSKEWTDDDIKKATSEEALTAVVMQRYHVYTSVRRELGSKLGKMQVAS
ncbi:MAG TPA: ATP-binding protein [Pyrinomonadaceae bacterium]|jgi:hypothetical protein